MTPEQHSQAWASWLEKAPHEAQVALDLALEGCHKYPDYPGFYWVRQSLSSQLALPPRWKERAALVEEDPRNPERMLWNEMRKNLDFPGFEAFESGISWAALLQARGDLTQLCPPWRVPEGVRVEAGTFWMGTLKSDWGHTRDEGLHRVVITRPFWLGKYPITQQEWLSLTGQSPTQHPENPRCPIDTISWYDAVQFCNRLSIREGLEPVYELDPLCPLTCKLSANGYRLPTEAEWEYAARAGEMGCFSGGAKPEDVAWFFANREVNHPHPVGQKCPNRWGLYDMSGNIQELVFDCYRSFNVKRVRGLPPEVDPTGPPTGSFRVARGGSYMSDLQDIRVYARGLFQPHENHKYLGFRLARTLAG